MSSLLQVAEFVDERPEEVKQMETFRSSAKWKLLGGEFQQEINLNFPFIGEAFFFLLFLFFGGMHSLFLFVIGPEKYNMK